MRTASLRQLAGEFDLFLIDQFGVLHDGTKPYPGVLDALRALRDAGRTVVILSNSGKRAEPNERRMEKLGFSRTLWDLFVTSGETARSMLERGEILPVPPRTCHVVSRDGDASVLDGLGIRLAEDPAEAECILIAGSEAPQVTLADYERRLRGAAQCGVPAVCVNPDMTMLLPEGLAFAPGRIARLYESLGGTVVWIGKPHPAIYRSARARFPEARRVICIGDSVEHDIAGGRSAGFATALVRTGIHADENEEALEAEFSRHGVRPDFVLPRLAWD